MPIIVTMPALSPTMTEGIIAKWLKNEGDLIEPDDPLCEITTDKSTLEYQSIEKGFLRKIVIAEGAAATVNQPIAILTETADEDISQALAKAPDVTTAKEEDEEALAKEAVPAAEAKGGAGIDVMTFAPAGVREHYVFSQQGEEVFASPLAKRLAKEQHLDLASVEGSGPHGRVVAKDLEFAQKKGPVAFGVKERPQYPPGSYEEIPLTPMRKVIGERLQASKISVPHFYITDIVHVDALMKVRQELKEGGIKLTFNDFVVRAAALALREHSPINRGYNSQNNTMIQFQTVDIALAVSIPDGLITPIICHADYKNVMEISRETKQLAKGAKENTLKPEEYQGGSFTVSNLGMFGIEAFDAVINPPQAGILAVGGMRQVPVVRDGAIVIGHTMAITLSGDHRVIDGKDGAVFVKTVVRYLEHPSLLLL